MSFPRYPAYKPSGVEWLGEVPSEWKVKPLKSIAYVINGFPFDSKLFDPSEGFPLVRIRDLNKSSPDTRYKGEFVDSAAISNDDVLIGMDGDFNVGRWLGEVPALLNQRMCCVKADTPAITRYLQYLLPAPLDAINRLTYATTVKHLSSFDVLKIRLTIPPDESHIAEIVSFLDRETAKIDALIAEQQRLIELLQEKRQAVISQAVTKGLNPDAPMKDSGVEWLGKVPEHWDVAPLKRNWIAVDCKHITADFTEDGYPLASIREAQGRWVNLEAAKRTTEDFYSLLIEGNRRPVAGDLIFTRNATVGEVAEVPAQIESFALGQDVAILKKCRPGQSSAYAWFLLRSSSLSNQIECAMIGSTFRRINVEQIRSLVIPVPPDEEQSSIATFLESIDAKWTLQRQSAYDCMALLQERRSALISAAVTGQIDVRGLVEAEASEQ